MKEKKIVIKVVFLTLVLISTDLIDLCGQDRSMIQLIDSRNKTPIPFAYIKVVGKNSLVLSDEDGYFSIPAQKGDSIYISHVAYTTLKTTYEEIKSIKTIELKELAIETNPIIISANSARTFVERAIDSSYKSLTEPMYYTCYRLDRVLYRDTLVVKAQAEITYICENFFTPSHGGIIKGYLKNIIVERIPEINRIQIPQYDINAPFAPFNRFIVGVSKTIEKHIYYSKQEVNDSVIIISVNPRLDFKPKNYVLKYGRFIINSNSWKILRIDTNLSPEMLEVSRSEKFKSKKSKQYLYDYYYSHVYDNQGNLLKVISSVHYSYLENNPDKIWQNHSELVFFHEKTKPIINASSLLKRDTSLIQMNSKYSTEFEKKFDNCINYDGDI
jgi:hypothetical protein